MKNLIIIVLLWLLWGWKIGIPVLVILFIKHLTNKTSDYSFFSITLKNGHLTMVHNSKVKVDKQFFEKKDRKSKQEDI